MADADRREKSVIGEFFPLEPDDFIGPNGVFVSQEHYEEWMRRVLEGEFSRRTRGLRS